MDVGVRRFCWNSLPDDRARECPNWVGGFDAVGSGCALEWVLSGLFDGDGSQWAIEYDSSGDRGEQFHQVSPVCEGSDGSVVQYGRDGSDKAGLFSEQVFFINVNDANEAPIDLVLSQMVVLENNALNTLIGIFSTIDKDRNSTFTYQLVSGVGSIDNSLFAIQGNELRLAGRSDFEAKFNCSIRVRVTDSLGLSREEVLAISVTDQEELPLFISLV
jgi:YD repeat-containing protein